MSSINEVATQKVFQGLTCAYTGKPVTVRVVASSMTRPLFFSPDAFDPSLPLPTLKELLEKASSRNGVAGSVSGENILVCAYTGKKLKILHDAAGFSLVGGFRPSCPSPDPAAFAHNMRSRGGVNAAPSPEPAPRITFLKEKPVVTSGSATPKDSSLTYAENALKGVLPGKTVVGVTVEAPRRGRRKAVA